MASVALVDHRHDDVAAQFARRVPALSRELRAVLGRRLGLTDDEFQDFFQDACEEVVSRQRRGEEILDLRAFLAAVIVNKRRMQLRSWARHPSAGLDTVDERPWAVLRAPSPPVDEQAELNARARDILEASLSIRDHRAQRVFHLRRVAGWAPEEIQQQLGISERTYRKLVTRGAASVAASITAALEGRWCEHRRPALEALADGTAGPEDAEDARRHLARCAPCRLRFAPRRAAA
jgi:RNA polymerase sigma factor (sigma-70 family)